MGAWARIFTSALVWGAGARLGCEIGRRAAEKLGVRDRRVAPDDPARGAAATPGDAKATEAS